jgi:hypothetical protein
MCASNASIGVRHAQEMGRKTQSEKITGVRKGRPYIAIGLFPTVS